MRPWLIPFEVNPFRLYVFWLFDICVTFCDHFDRSDFQHITNVCLARTYSKLNDPFEFPGRPMMSNIEY